MMQVISIFLAAILTSTTLSAPTALFKRSNPHGLSPLAPNTQSCSYATGGTEDTTTTYHVQIGVDFASGSGCDNIHKALKTANIDVTGWNCTDDGNGESRHFQPRHAAWLSALTSDVLGDTLLKIETYTGEGPLTVSPPTSNVTDVLALEYQMVGDFTCSPPPRYWDLAESDMDTPAALSKRDDYGVVAPNTQHCSSVGNTVGEYISYSVRVGRPYDSGSGCSNIHDALTNEGIHLRLDFMGSSTYACKDDDAGT